jgi:putative colanic acid biosynthesis acetyltransferase WcaF
MTVKQRLSVMRQDDGGTSPWPLRARLAGLLWHMIWQVLFRPTPKPMYRWRNHLLKLFGCKISGVPFVDASVRIKMPWNLVLEDAACLGPYAEVYNLATVTLGARCTIAQHVYLCGGAHDLSTPSLPLMIGEISLGSDSFVGAKALILPGVVVSRDMPSWTVCAGNPCRPIKPRQFARPAVSSGEKPASSEVPAAADRNSEAPSTPGAGGTGL